MTTVGRATTTKQEGVIMKTRIIIAAVPALFLAACATTPPTTAEIDSCRTMEGQMGLQSPHDHGEMKQQGLNPMNLSHDRCRRILGDSK